LEGTLKKREAEIVSLRERLDLTRRLIALADRWDQSCHKLQDTEDRYVSIPTTRSTPPTNERTVITQN
jgi:hypothetical protein